MGNTRIIDFTKHRRDRLEDGCLAKTAALKEILADMEGVLVAYSGGTDSTFLLAVAQGVLGDNVLAVTARAPIFTASEMAAAEEMARRLGVRHLFVRSGVLDEPRFSSNPPDRCYLCKRALFSRLRGIAQNYGYEVADGSNLDDLGEYRPGLRALRELGVRSPLVEADLTKADIRSLSREMGLPTWDQPSQTCLSTRFPYGDHLTEEDLRRVEKAEEFLHSLGLTQLRVRVHGMLARVEVPEYETVRVLRELAPQIVDEFKALGYTYISLDLEGYRTGSMDEVLES